MFIKQTYVRFISVCVIFCFIIGCLLNWAPQNNLETCNCENGGRFAEDKYGPASHYLRESKDESGKRNGKPKLAIIVPYRERFEELLNFVPHMHKFLTKQDIPFHIFVVNQKDRYRFNRASLINAGFLYVEKDFDYIAMHDVDLLPLNDKLEYRFPKNGPLHIAAPELHPKYHYPTFVGGILLVSKEHFRLTDGMSNKYWGWGLEDDEFYVRLMDADLKVFRPENIKTGINDTFLHIHDRAHRKRDTTKCFNQREATRKRDRETGLHTLKHRIESVHKMTLDSVPFTILNILLDCDKQLTPWCDCEADPPVKSTAKKGATKNKT